MTVPFWCLFAAALIPILLAFAGGYFKAQQFGSVDNNNPRAQSAQLTGTGARALAAHCPQQQQIGAAQAPGHLFVDGAHVALRGARERSRRGRRRLPRRRGRWQRTREATAAGAACSASTDGAPGSGLRGCP